MLLDYSPRLNGVLPVLGKTAHKVQYVPEYLIA